MAANDQIVERLNAWADEPIGDYMDHVQTADGLMRDAADTITERERDEWRGNVDRVVGLMADADRRATAAEAAIARLRDEVIEVERERDHYKSGLQTLASTFYKEDQHQDYAKHILDTALRALQESDPAKEIDLDR